jgi:DDE superfamily endonuclease
VWMFFAPRQGWRPVKVTDRRTTQDVAHGMRDLGALQVPTAAVIRVVVENLHTHTPAALDATLPPAEAWRIMRKVAFHVTPKHGRWLNMAEIAFAVVATQCLDRRLGHQETVRRAVTAWETRRHAAKAIVDWRFTTTKARRKLKHIYP